MPLFWLALAFVAGIVLGSLWALPGWGWLLVGLAGGGLPFALARTRLAHLVAPLAHSPAPLTPAPALLLAAACLGAGRYGLAHPPLTAGDLAFYNDQGRMQITARVVAPPEGALLRLQARQVQPLDPDSGAASGSPIPVRGQLLANLPDAAGYRYGDLLRLEGEPAASGDAVSTSYGQALARQGVATWLSYPRVARLQSGLGSPLLRALYELRAKAVGVLGRLFPPAEAALLAGILLGDETQIPPDLRQAFQDTGTAHIVAISGFNIAILAGLLAAGFTRLLGQRKGALATVVGLGLYTVLVGASASVVRAALMGSLALFARQVGRRQQALNTLGGTALGMCLFNPGYPWDVSFQLSFMATLGLVLYAGPLQAGFERWLARRLSPVAVRRLAGPVGEYVLFTLAAQVTTLPVLAYHFGRLSPVSLVANPLVLPPQPLVMVLGGLATLGGLAWEPLGRLLAALAWPFVTYTIRVVEALGALPNASVSVGPVGLPLVALAYLLLFGLTLGLRPRLGGLKFWLPNLGLLGLTALAALTWRSLLGGPDGRLHLVLLGEALLIQAPQGGLVLVGPAEPDALARWLPPMQRRLDLLVVPAYQSRPPAGLAELLDVYPPDQTLVLGGDPAPELVSLLDRAGVTPRVASLGQGVLLGPGGELRVVEAGERGAGLELRWKDLRAWVASGDGGASPGCQDPVGLLVLSREALRKSDLSTWQTACRPQATLLLGLPDPSGGTAVGGLSHAWVEAVSDGERLWLQAPGK